MQISNIWNKFHLHGSKIVGIVLICLYALPSFGQYQNVRMNNPNYDDRLFSYGFLIGIHNTSLKLEYSDRFVSNDFDTLHSILPRPSAGFSLGFIVNMRLNEYLDLRLLPKVAFYEHDLVYNYTSQRTQIELKESTIIEFPLMLKYKSERRGNSRMYMVGGLKPAIAVSGKNDVNTSYKSLNIKRGNLNADFGFGFDLYFPLFKFSPEIRFSKGLINVLEFPPNELSEGISSLKTNTIHFYLLFQ